VLYFQHEEADRLQKKALISRLPSLDENKLIDVSIAMHLQLLSSFDIYEMSRINEVIRAIEQEEKRRGISISCLLMNRLTVTSSGTN